MEFADYRCAPAAPDAASSLRVVVQTQAQEITGPAASKAYRFVIGFTVRELSCDLRVYSLMKMIPLIAALAVQISAASVGFAEQPCKSTVVGDLRIEHFESKMYGSPMTVRVWLPPGYADAAK